MVSNEVARCCVRLVQAGFRDSASNSWSMAFGEGVFLSTSGRTHELGQVTSRGINNHQYALGAFCR